jgi:hypothetical protein
MHIGGGNASYGMDGRVQEILMYKYALTPVQLLGVNSYLAIKYGVTMYQTPATNYVSSANTIVRNATTNGIYKHDIA